MCKVLSIFSRYTVGTKSIKVTVCSSKMSS